MPRGLSAVALAACLAVLPVTVVGQSWTLTNPTGTGKAYENEVVRLKINLPISAKQGEYTVKADGKEVLGQIGEYEGRKWMYVVTSLAEDQAIEYSVSRGRPKSGKPLVSLKKVRGVYELSNGRFAVKLPAEADNNIPSPILAIRGTSGKWVGSGFWQTGRTLDRFSAEVLGEGPIFAKVRLRYEFDGNVGLYENTPAFATVDVTVFPDQQHAVVEEAHAMDRGDYWEFDCASGWNARRAICVTHGKMPAHGGPAIPAPTSLRVNQTRMGDTLVNLQPRWTQAFDEGWLFVCHDDHNAVGAIPCRAARWHWPHSNLIEVKVKPSADYAGLRCPTWKGRRYWYLVSGTRDQWDESTAKQYITRHAFVPLDKLLHDYILAWPGLERLLATPKGKGEPKLGTFRGFDFYSSWMNPTSGLRGYGRRLIKEPGKQGNLDTLTQAQVFLDNDSYGSYWNYWSPENPNFFTDYHRCGILLTTQLKKHPRHKELAALAELKFREDMFHSITLPGGAGQECPGYVAHAMKSWSALAPICRQHLGFDPTRWPRFRAGASFLVHLSQPIAPGQRRCHPGGDTHPLGPDVFAVAAEYGVREDAKRFKTEELPGFGVVFRNRPGTAEETYLAFKSGPNRGHYHGDQLSFHYCASARQVAIDHMCSYGPRAGQEHMHNRVAFHTDKLPWANMDGYERVIALKTSKDVDIAVGQVDSDRLRVTTEYPPEGWDVYLPEQRFDKQLKYRRTIVCLKNRGRDYFVLRDQHIGPEVKATYCLHVLSDKCDAKGNTVRFGNLTLYCAHPQEFTQGRHDWNFEKKGKDGSVILKENTKGVRLAVDGESSEFITVLYPGNKPPKMEAIENGVRVGDDEITFAGGVDDDDAVNYVTVSRSGKVVTQLIGRDIDMDRSQGEIGLFVPDAGYPFGEIPEWLIRQRSRIPDWASGWARKHRVYDAP